MTNIIELTIHPRLATSTNRGMLSVEEIYNRIGLAPPRRAAGKDREKTARGWYSRLTATRSVYVESFADRNDATFASLWRDCLGAALRTDRWSRETTLRGSGDAQLLDHGRPVPLWHGEVRDYVFVDNVASVQGQQGVDLNRYEHLSWGHGCALIPTDELLAKLSAGGEDVIVHRVPSHLRGKPMLL